MDAQQEIHPEVLAAVDGSASSLKAVDYAAGLTGLIPKIRFVLLYVLPQIPPFVRREAQTDGAMRIRLKKMEAANREQAEEIMKNCRDRLVDSGIAPERVETRIRNRHSGLAKDILTEAELGRFDALIIGRRGLTRAQEVFMGSVSNQLVQHAANVPLWINDGQTSNRNILAAVDGSQASLKAVDHLAFMLSGSPDARIDLLHVTPKFQNHCVINPQIPEDFDEEAYDGLEVDFERGQVKCMDDFMEQAVKTLQNAGISSDRIKMETREINLGVARTIIRAAKEGGYGTVVVGRRGLGGSSFLGGISDRVVRRAENLAVWLVN